jgi:hypothetical protein
MGVVTSAATTQVMLGLISLSEVFMRAAGMVVGGVCCAAALALLPGCAEMDSHHLGRMVPGSTSLPSWLCEPGVNGELVARSRAVGDGSDRNKCSIGPHLAPVAACPAGANNTGIGNNGTDNWGNCNTGALLSSWDPTTE